MADKKQAPKIKSNGDAGLAAAMDSGKNEPYWSLEHSRWEFSGSAKKPVAPKASIRAPKK